MLKNLKIALEQSGNFKSIKFNKKETGGIIVIIFKCKMCGGDLEVQKGDSIGICSYCGSTMTLPKLDDVNRANLYDRANHYRRNKEFDKAISLYESILIEDKTDAEAYWSLVLCKYGIEYIEDTKSHKRIPTCNRTLYTSIFSDEDYKKALEYADSSAKRFYEEEAKIIDAIQKGILEISSKEEPFDIFICYKETDNYGNRTPDSVLAQEIYYQFKNEGYKIFFSRITLESVLGTAYEPYIFAALNSSKVMVVVGTRPEYFSSPWVKNEWSRFLGLIKSGSKKTLIPAYKDMDPYDLPDDFSHLQSQDMSKLGFISDLNRGIKKILDTKEFKENKVDIIQVQSDKNVAALLKRAFLMLEDGNFPKAEELLEQVLNLNPELSQAYLGKLMVEFNIKNQFDLKNIEKHISESINFQKVLRFSSLKEKEEMINLNNEIEKNISVSEDNRKYTEIYNLFNNATNQWELEQALIMINDHANKSQRFLDLNDMILDKKFKLTYDVVFGIYNHSTDSDGLDLALKLIDESNNPRFENIREQILNKKKSLVESELKKILSENIIEFDASKSFEENIDQYIARLITKYPKYMINQEILYSFSNFENYQVHYKNHVIETRNLKIKKKKILAITLPVILVISVLLAVFIIIPSLNAKAAENARIAKEIEAENAELREMWNGTYIYKTETPTTTSEIKVDILKQEIIYTFNSELLHNDIDVMFCQLNDTKKYLNCTCNTMRDMSFKLLPNGNLVETKYSDEYIKQ